MQPLADRWDAQRVEEAVRSFWASRKMADGNGEFGPSSGLVTHQFLGSVTPLEGSLGAWRRAVVGDAAARALAMAGHRSRTTLLSTGAPKPIDPGEESIERWLRVRKTTFRPEDVERVQPLLAQLAARGELTTRSAPMQACPSCRSLVSPEMVVHSEEPRKAFWVRFPLEGDPHQASAIVWTDAAWKLLGTTAIGFDMETPYAFVRVARRGANETVLLAKRALPRLSELVPDAECEVVDERPGSALANLRYRHPMASVFPALADLPAPASALVPVEALPPRGTGFVPVTPSHGFADSVLAERIQLPSWPVVGLDGLVDGSFRTAYAHLPLAAADSFAQRDLEEAGVVFTIESGSRGVPRCAICGDELVWIPARTWVLEPGRLASGTRSWYDRLVPGAHLPQDSSEPPWPVASSEVTERKDGFVLFECSACERLTATPVGERCTCGGRLAAASRTLLPGFGEAVAGVAGQGPYLPGESVRILIPDRGRGPTTLHLLAALEAAEVTPASVSLLRIPCRVPRMAFPRDAQTAPPEAWRLALLGLNAPARGSATIPGEARQSSRRLSVLWTVGRDLVASSIAFGFAPDLFPITTLRPDLLPEDLALISVFEGVRSEVQRCYESGDFPAAVRLLFAFQEGDLQEAYHLWLRHRVKSDPVVERTLSALRTLWQVVPLLADLFAPIAPATSEALHRSFRGDRESLFARGFAPVSEGLIDPAARSNLARWLSVARTVDTARRRWLVPDGVNLDEVVLDVPDEAVARELSLNSEIVGRVCRTTKLTVASKLRPFDRYQQHATPVPAAIQEAYGTNAPRIARVLSTMPAAKVLDGLRTQSLSIALDGMQHAILPAMVEVASTLPDGWVVEPSDLGSVFVKLPAASGRRPPRGWPALSAEGQRVVRALLEATSADLHGPRPGPIRILATGNLKDELGGNRRELESFLAGYTVEVNNISESLVDVLTVRGRTLSGSPWAIQFAAIPRPGSDRPRLQRSADRLRVSPRRSPIEPKEDEQLLSAGVRERDALLRETSQRLDSALGVPLIGPAKLAYAYDAGLRDYESFTTASYDALQVIPGFGPDVAEAIVTRFGGVVPAKPPRATRAPEPEASIPPVEEPMVVEATLGDPLAVVPDTEDSADEPEESTPSKEPSVGAGGVGVAAVAAVAAASRVVEPPPVPAPPEGGVELVIDASDQTWQRFLEATSAGHHGLCISREFPDRVRSRVGHRAVDIVWLSNAGRENSLRPTDLNGLKDAVVRSVGERSTTVVLLSGLEYLLLLHPTEAMAGILRELDSFAHDRGVQVWVPVESGLTDSGKLAALESSLAAG